jgi:hypothetical protein
MKAQFKITIISLSICFAGQSLAQDEVNIMTLDKVNIDTKELISNTKRIVSELKAKVMSFEGIANEDMAYFESKFAELSVDTNTISQVFRQVKVDHIDGYFNVETGSFKKQLSALSTALGIDTVRFQNISDCMDWNIDSAFKLKISDAETALNTFINELPISYEYLERDNSITVNGLESSQQCESKE